MNINFNNLFKAGKTFFEKNKSKILLSASWVTGALAIVEAVKVTPAAHEKIKEAEAAKGDKLTKVEVVKCVWKDYVPVAVAFGASCVTSGMAVQHEHKEVMAVSAACETLISQLNENQAKLETKDNNDNTKTSVNPETGEEEVQAKYVFPTDSEMWFIESLSGRQFKSSYNTIMSAVNEFNKNVMLGTANATPNEWFTYIGLDPLDTMDNMEWPARYSGGVTIRLDHVEEQNGTLFVIVGYDELPSHESYI